MDNRRGSVTEVFWAFLGLGCTSFGGPVAHLGYFREAFVKRRKWLDEHAYADLVALCQFLPGPASSQVGIGLGIRRAGLLGGCAAWVGFTLPSALAMVLFAYGFLAVGAGAEGGTMAGALHGLKVVAVAVVAQAVWGMARTLCPDAARAGLAILAAVVVIGIDAGLGRSAWAQVMAIVVGGIAGRLFLAPASSRTEDGNPVRIGRATAVTALVLFFALLLGLPVLAEVSGSPMLSVIDGFYRAGSLVFGGGHVILPLLQAEVVPPGWVGNDAFLAGYGAAQAVPGPLFTFAAYLGTVMNLDGAAAGWLGGLIALVAVFVPSFLLIVGCLPLWHTLCRNPGVQSALAGVNAAVVGLLLAALYDPVWTSAILAPPDFALGLVAFGLLMFARIPPWLVVLLAAAGGAGLAAIA